MTTPSLHARVLRFVAIALLCAISALSYHGVVEYKRFLEDKENFLNMICIRLGRLSIHTQYLPLYPDEMAPESAFSATDVLDDLRELGTFRWGYPNYVVDVAGPSGMSFREVEERLRKAIYDGDAELSDSMLEFLHTESLGLVSALSREGGLTLDDMYSERNYTVNTDLSTEETNAIFREFFEKMEKKDLLYEGSAAWWGGAQE